MGLVFPGTVHWHWKQERATGTRLRSLNVVPVSKSIESFGEASWLPPVLFSGTVDRDR